MGHIFVSYSRAEFYHAETVTAVINRTGGTRAWLDVEQLQPGADWAGGITAALDEADALLLMASPAALRSPYVRDEWTRALAAGKPVHVAIVRTVSLPAELAHCPKHDLRTRFLSRSRRLAAELNGRAPVSPTTLRPRPAVPFMVLLAMALLCFGIVTASAFALVDWDAQGHYAGGAGQAGTDRSALIVARYARFFLALMICNLVIAAGLGVVLTRLLNRNATPTALRQGFGALFAGMGLNQITLELTPNSAIRMYGFAAMAAAAAGAILVSWSRTLHLWMPTGEGAHHVRQRLLGRPVRGRKELVRSFAYQWRSYEPRFAALKESLAGAGSVTSYDIEHEDADERIATRLAAACNSAGFVREYVDPRWRFVLVSAYSNVATLTLAQAVFGERAVFVLASSVRLPPEIDADDALIRRSQWLDFRDQSPVMVYELLSSVVSTEQAKADPMTVPTAPERFHGPKYLTNFLGWAHMLAAFVAVVPLALLIANSSPLSQTLPIVVVAVVLIVVTFRLVWLTAMRRMTAKRWRLRAWLLFLTLVLWAVLFPISSVFPPVFRALFTVLLRIAVPLTMVIGLPGLARGFREQWLPPAESAESTGTIGAVTPRLFSLPWLAFIAALTTGMVFIAPLPGTP